MKRIIFVLVLGVAYAGSLAWKAREVEIVKNRDIPTLFKFRNESGTPVRIARVESKPLINTATITGLVEGQNRVVAQITPELVGRIKQGATAFITNGSKRINGHIQSIARSASLLSGLHEVVAYFPQLGELETAQVQVEVSRLNGVRLVKREAISTRHGQAHAFTVRDGIVERADVTIQASNNDFYAIKSGLNVGDSVVISDQRYLTSGERILVVE